MSAMLLSDYRLAVAATASSAAADYPASGALVPGVSRGWKSTAGGSQWLQLDFGASVVLAAVAVQEIIASVVAHTTIAVYANTFNPPTTLRGIIENGLDGNGRDKGAVAFTTAARYLCLVFSGAPAGDPYYVGSVLPFATATVLAADPLYGASSINLLDAQVRNELRNGIVEAYAAGAASTDLELGFRTAGADDMESVRRAARAGPCWFDFGLTDRGRQWPVRHIEAQTARRLDGYNRESLTLKLREII